MIRNGGKINPNTSYPSTWPLIYAVDVKGNWIRCEYGGYTSNYCVLGQQTKYIQSGGTGNCVMNDAAVNVDYGVLGRRITKLSWKEGSVVFNYGTATRTDLNSTDGALGNVEVFSKYDELNPVRRWELQHDYFNIIEQLSSSCMGEYSGPLRLKTVQEKSRSGTCVPPYEFFYSGNVPDRNSHAQDHWGFYNGVGNSSQVPELVVPGLNGNGVRYLPGADRRPNAFSGSAGILSQIKYPTGGTSTFEYEGHDAYMADFQSEARSSRPLKSYATILKSELSGQGIKRVSFSLPNDALVGLSVFRLSSCDPSIREGGCGGEVYVRGLEPEAPSFFIGLDDRREFYLSAGNYELVMNSFGPPENIQFESAEVVGPDLNGIPEYNKPIGGARVRKIIHSTPGSPDQSIQYVYRQEDQPDRSSGSLIDAPSYWYFIERQMEAVGVGIVYIPDCFFYAIHSSSVLPLGNTQGSHISYSHVEEINYSGTIHNGKVATTYSIEFDEEYSSFPYAQAASMDMLRGLVLGEKVFKHMNGGYQLVRSITNEYGRSTSEILRVKDKGLIYGCRTFHPVAGCWSPERSLSYDTSIWYVKVRETSKEFVNGQEAMLSITEFDYQNPAHKNPTLVKKKNSKGEWEYSQTRYLSDFANGDLDPLSVEMLNQAHMPGLPVQTIESLSKAGIENVTNSNIVRYKKVNGQYYVIDEAYKFLQDKPVVKSSLQDFPEYKPLVGIPSGKYLQMSKYEYDGLSNVVWQQTVSGQEAYVWGYDGTLPVAKVPEALPAEIAYTSFEIASFGNWTISGAVFNSSDAFAGSRSLHLSAGSVVSSPVLFGGREYILSYWSKNGALSVPQSSTKMGEQSAGWTRWEHRLAGAGTGVQITGAGQIIDELKLHPAASLMHTFVYKPLVGLTAAGDVNGRVAAYEYDDLSRLTLIRDGDRNVLRKIEYSMGCGSQVFASDDLSGNYTRNNCPAGSSGTTVYVSIPASMFSSTVSKEDANVQALAYAQNQANLNGQCISGNVTVTANVGVSGRVVVTLTNQITGQAYSRLMTNGINQNVATVPVGVYNIRYEHLDGLECSFGILPCGYFTWGTVATIFSVNVNSGCNILDISF